MASGRWPGSLEYTIYVYIPGSIGLEGAWIWLSNLCCHTDQLAGSEQHPPGYTYVYANMTIATLCDALTSADQGPLIKSGLRLNSHR